MRPIGARVVGSPGCRISPSACELYSVTIYVLVDRHLDARAFGLPDRNFFESFGVFLRTETTSTLRASSGGGL